MGRRLNGTSSDFLQSASAIDLSAFQTISIQCWALFDDFVNVYVMLETSANSDSNAGAFGFFTKGTSGLYTQCTGNVGADVWQQTTNPTTSSWHHYVIIYDFTAAAGSEVSFLYVDNVAQTASSQTGPNNTGSFGNYILNIGSRNAASNFTLGNIAEIAIWGGIALSSTDVNNLFASGAGVDARTVQSGNLNNYWQICGTASPEPALVGSVALNVTGTSFAIHPVTGNCGAATPGPTPAYAMRSALRW